MQIKRLLDDREVFVGDKVFDAQGRSYAFVEHSSGELVVASEDERCNDPALSAQVRPLMYMPQRVFSSPMPGEGVGCCTSRSSR